jgi:hypothetical protein
MPKLSVDTRERPSVSRKEARGANDVTALLKQYGTVSNPIYEWGGYRYTNAHDAIAAAKRGMSA